MQFFSLRITALVFPFLFFPPSVGRERCGGRSGGAEPGETEKGGCGKEKNWASTAGWTALSLSLGSAWRLAKLTEPILSGCHCNINTHLEQMWLKAWNIEQTAATDPVPLQEHLCSINALRSRGREGSLYSLSPLADGASGGTAAMPRDCPRPKPTWPLRAVWLRPLVSRSSSILLQIYLYREITFFFFFF